VNEIDLCGLGEAFHSYMSIIGWYIFGVNQVKHLGFMLVRMLRMASGFRGFGGAFWVYVVYFQVKHLRLV
jgi:hypothetical protein